MSTIVKVLIGLAILAFALAVLGVVWETFGIAPEALSRASNNLALIAIALSLCWKRGSTAT